MALKTKFINKDDFKNYFGIDLEHQLEVDVNSFLGRNEVIIATILDSQYFQKIDAIYPEFTDYQKEHYKYALLEQAYYMFRNGDISSDSGYDPDSGRIDNIKSLVLAPMAKEHLILCGLLSRKIDWREDGNRFIH